MTRMEYTFNIQMIKLSTHNYLTSLFCYAWLCVPFVNTSWSTAIKRLKKIYFLPWTSPTPLERLKIQHF